jgi:hypothetical protein
MLARHFGLEAKGLVLHAKYFQIWLARAGNREAALEFAVTEAARAVAFIVSGSINTTAASPS